MNIDQRDLAIVQLVSRFGQLTSKQLQQLLFSDLKSHTPAARSLDRLVERRYLARIERRVVGGSRGGSGQYVYQLGAEGWRLCREGRPALARAVNYHSLAIADCYVLLRALERSGSLVIKGVLTEPDSHVVIGRFQLKPDLYVELERPDGANSIRFMIEIDMGTQGPRQITDKFVRYWNAYNAADEGVWPANQLVLFVAVDNHRAQELRWLLDRGDKDQQAIFRVRTLETLETELT